MTSLPSGLASISSRLDDTPNVRGAVAFGKAIRAEEERRKNEMFRAIVDSLPTSGPTTLAQRVKRCEHRIDTLGSAIDRHAQLAVSAGYRSTDRR